MSTTFSGQVLEVDRSNWGDTRLVAQSYSDDLQNAEVLIEIDRFALTANNISYASAGDLLGYWSFFPAEDNWGRIPVMGYGNVVASAHPDIAVGERLWGFYPMGSYLLVEAGKVNEHAFSDVSEHRKGDHDYFRALDAQMRLGGLAAMLHDLLDMDLSGFQPEGDRPETEALSQQKNLSMQPADKVVHNMLMQGEPSCDFIPNTQSGGLFVATRLLASETRLDAQHESSLAVALRALAGVGTRSARQRIGQGQNRRQYRGFWLPPLEECRRRWERYLERSVAWPEEVQTWALEAAPTPEDYGDHTF